MTTTSRIESKLLCNVCVRSGSSAVHVPMHIHATFEGNPEGYPVYEPCGMFNTGSVNLINWRIVDDQQTEAAMRALVGSLDWKSLMKCTSSSALAFEVNLGNEAGVNRCIHRLENIELGSQLAECETLLSKLKEANLSDSSYKSTTSTEKKTRTSLMDCSNYKSTAREAIPQNQVFPGPSSLQMSMAIYDDDIMLVPGGFAPPNPGVTLKTPASDAAPKLETACGDAVFISNNACSDSDEWVVMQSPVQQ